MQGDVTVTKVSQRPSLTILKLPEVQQRTGLSRSQIYSLIAQGRFPSQVKLGGVRARASGWVDAEINEWIHDRLAEARAPRAKR
jgi:prophage regulatory protein